MPFKIKYKGSETFINALRFEGDGSVSLYRNGIEIYLEKSFLIFGRRLTRNEFQKADVYDCREHECVVAFT